MKRNTYTTDDELQALSLLFQTEEVRLRLAATKVQECYIQGKNTKKAYEVLQIAHAQYLAVRDAYRSAKDASWTENELEEMREILSSEQTESRAAHWQKRIENLEIDTTQDRLDLILLEMVQELVDRVAPASPSWGDIRHALSVNEK